MSLDVYLDGIRVGGISPVTGTDYSFAYERRIVEDAGVGAIVLSNSLPVRDQPYAPIETRSYFDGLLPEDSRRDELARELRVSSNDGYALLAELGRDCAGAVVILPEGDEIGPSEGAVDWMTDGELEALVERLPRHPLGVSREHRKMRLSLAGVQRKLTLIRSGSGRFGEPRADAPSTHLIKPQYGEEYPDLVHNEMFCMTVARCAGLPVAETSIHTIAGRPCLLSRRFDRRSDGKSTTRLHQEDLCQALGVPANLKYEETGGPGFRQFRELLTRIGAGADVGSLVNAAVCNFVLGNSDAHGKNFAVLFAEQGQELAPLYDIVCTAVYGLDDAMAMSIGDVFDPEAVGRIDWIDMSHDCDLPIEAFLQIVRDAAGRIRDCAESVAALAKAEGWHVPLIDRIVEVVRRRDGLIASAID